MQELFGEYVWHGIKQEWQQGSKVAATATPVIVLGSMLSMVLQAVSYLIHSFI